MTASKHSMRLTKARLRSGTSSMTSERAAKLSMMVKAGFGADAVERQPTTEAQRGVAATKPGCRRGRGKHRPLIRLRHLLPPAEKRWGEKDSRCKEARALVLPMRPYGFGRNLCVTRRNQRLVVQRTQRRSEDERRPSSLPLATTEMLRRTSNQT